MDDEEVIRQQMEETRTSLTEKLETLENHVTEKVMEATSALTDSAGAVKDTVQETVATVKDTVQGTVATVKDTVHEGVETVKDWLDLSAHVEKHPWLMMGGSVCVGFCIEGLTRKSHKMTTEPAASGHGRPHHNGHGSSREKRRSEAAAPSLLSSLDPEITKLKALALGTLLGTVREMVVRAAPEHVGGQLRELIDSTTKKLGGEPIPAFEPSSAAEGSHFPSTYSQRSTMERPQGPMGRIS
jgi:ElaB/YqjD/DUF883 family membrane-anchored ribosome-binding protein